MQSQNESAALGWFGVRSLFRLGRDMYEERITLHRARDLDDALRRATAAAWNYADEISTEGSPVEYLSTFGQAYSLADDPTNDGAEVFSLIRDSDLGPQDYVERHFDTGAEHHEEA